MGLEGYWFPVGYSGFSVKEVNLLGQEILVLKAKEGYVALQNRCPHRGYKLSKSKVLDDRIKCSYHGWEFNFNGDCVYVPSSNSRGHVKLRKYQVKEKYSIVWVSLGNPVHDVPEFPEYDEQSFRKIRCGPYSFNANPFRVFENLLDVSHFPFVHEGYLGSPSYAKIPSFNVKLLDDRVVAEGIQVWQPNPDGTGEGKYTSYTYTVLDPLVLHFRKDSSDKVFSMYFALLPEGKERTTVFAWIAMNYAFEVPEEKIREFEDTVLAQDKVILENQPTEFYLDVTREAHVEADKHLVAYRHWLRKKVGRVEELGLV
ncbi:MAG: aromatic ring-hydroxylating dioxygenase subunit alpha [Candidatus Aramenus sp.]|jgi:phenylpropionate dioxygenase-like ring-hydroxylating dioxygenase large terminal subunit|nr:aromatic ring-hydroxylating dioxygenase subunit alpha [Candidatus Aramenus sp.]